MDTSKDLSIGSVEGPAVIARLNDQPKTQQKKKNRRKRITLVLLLALAIVVAVAVAVPVVLLKNRNRRTYTDDELYFPTGYNGTTGMNGAIGGRRSAGRSNRPAPNASIYDDLVVFGSSYSDNAHARQARYLGTLAPTEGGYWQRRWSNGAVWTEYLRDYLGNASVTNNATNSTPRAVSHLNYAYGGATTNNSIHGAGAPDTGQQMQMWLAERDTNHKALIAMFTTTNDISTTFSDYLRNDTSVSGNLNASLAVIASSAQSLVNQLRGLIPSNNSNTGAIAPDYLILPILPVNLATQSRNIARDQGRQWNEVEPIMKTITERYNSVLMQGARSLASTLGNRGTVFTYDVPAWFYAIQERPSRYGIRDASTPCTNVGCTNPGRYVWWDHIHLVTTMQQRLANTVSQIVLFSNRTVPVG